MKSVYSICHEIEHYACMVDLLGRRGCLEEAITLVRGMPMRPDIVVWGAVLGACRIHKNVDLAKLVLKHLLELEPHGSGPYVLANIFGEDRKWEDVKNIRKLIKDGAVMKNRAVSSIEIDGRVNEFMVDDNRHSISSSIYFILDQSTDHLKSLGYKSYNPTALFDIEEMYCCCISKNCLEKVLDHSVQPSQTLLLLSYNPAQALYAAFTATYL